MDFNIFLEVGQRSTTENLIVELVTTEETYLQLLHIIVTEYMCAFKNNPEKFGASDSETMLQSFAGIKEVIEFQFQF